MIRKVMRIGNSNGVTLDKKMLQEVGLSGATYVWIEPDRKGNKIIIRERRETDW